MTSEIGQICTNNSVIFWPLDERCPKVMLTSWHKFSLYLFNIKWC